MRRGRRRPVPGLLAVLLASVALAAALRGHPGGQAGAGTAASGQRVPPRIVTTVYVGGALSGATRPVSLSLPSAGCDTAARGGARLYLSTIGFLDANLDSDHHGTLVITPASTPAAGAMASIHALLTFPGSGLTYAGTGTLAVAADGSGRVDFRAAAVGDGASPAPAAENAISGRVDWTCTS